MTGVITPSSHWQGTPAPGSRWTVEQLHTLAREGIHDAKQQPTATVLRRPHHNAEDWTMPPEPVRFLVPRLAKTRDGRRAKIVTPAGVVEWVDVVPHG